MSCEIRHPKWGSNLARQLEAFNLESTKRRKGLFQGSDTEPTYVRVSADDETRATRFFKHRCGLLRLIVMPQKVLVFFDGHTTSEVRPEDVTFRIAHEELKENNGKPIADVSFSGYGTRYNCRAGQRTHSLVCIFADEKQIGDYVTAAVGKELKGDGLSSADVADAPSLTAALLAASS